MLIAANLRWRGQGFVEWPPALQACMDRGVRGADSSCPVLNREAFAVALQPAVRSRVPHLLEARRPAHVAGFVAARIVDPIQGVPAARPWTDVAQERLKRFGPGGTDGDPATAVPAVRIVAGIIAAGFHREPVLIRRRGAHAVRSSPLANLVAFQTAATPGVMRAQRRTRRADLLPAGATTTPSHTATPRDARQTFDDRQPPDHLAGHIDTIRRHNATMLHQIGGH